MKTRTLYELHIEHSSYREVVAEHPTMDGYVTPGVIQIRLDHEQLAALEQSVRKAMEVPPTTQEPTR